MIKLRLSYFAYIIRRPRSLEKNNTGKSGRKEKKMTNSINWVELVTVMMGALLEDLKDQVEDDCPGKKSLLNQH